MKSKKLNPFYEGNNHPPKIRDGKSLYVDELFMSIQAEGPFNGHPAFFIRLWGCCLNCSFCDTPQKGYEPKSMSVKKILQHVEKKATTHMVVITGGEPFLYDLAHLVAVLKDKGYWVQFETCGLLAPKGVDLSCDSVYTICSPKTKTVAHSVSENALAFKYVVSVDNIQKKDGLPKGVFRPKSHATPKIMVSPEFTDDDKTTKANIQLALSICRTYGYWFTWQWHKHLGIQ